VPDRLAAAEFILDGDVAADVADAEAAVARMDAQAVALADTEALARLLLRAESVASSRIEGLEVGGRRLLRAEAAREFGDESADVTAQEVLGNIDAMAWAVQNGGPSTPITPEMLFQIHQRLMTGTRLEAHGGRLRAVQNWIGGSSYNPCSAVFVPPPPELVGELVDDLCDFCNDDSLPAVAQAAIAHAQFETIHPFVDGNGRTGRALIQLVLRRRGRALRMVPPVSLVLATWSDQYIDALTGTRYLGEFRSAAAHEGRNRWIALFAAACQRSVEDAARFEARLDELRQAWREQLVRVRAGSAVDLLIHAVAGAPIVTVTSASRLIDRSFQSTNEAVARLAEVGILRPVTVARRNRAFEAHEVIDAFTDFERQLASPVGDTRASPPTRSVPRRRQR
jgi:Fic family protein